MNPTRRQQLLQYLARGERELRLGNAAGTCKVLDGPHGVRELCRVPGITTITVGSYRFQAYSGNPGITEHLGDDGLAVNFLGIPTAKDFVEFCRDDLPEMVELVRQAGKQLCVSINDNDHGILVEMIKLLDQAGVQWVEINLACPNLEHGEMICYVQDEMRRLFERLRQEVSKLQILPGVKTGIYSNPAELARFAKLLDEYRDTIFFVTAVNTFPNSLLLDDAGEPVIKSGKGLGGGSGSMLKAIALGHIRQLRELLGPGYHINGVGGVSTGRDVIDMYLAGASEVQVGAAYYFGDAKIFTRLQQDIAAST